MPFDSSGVFNRVIPGGWKADAEAGIKIRADRHDDEDNGFATGLSTCITKDGRTQPTANLPMNNKKLTNLGDPADPGDAANRRYVDGKFGEVFTITGVDDAGRITFAGSQSPLATGEPLGISWTQADLFFGVKPLDVEKVGQLNRFVWNDKGNGLGEDMMTLSDDHVLTLIKKDDGAVHGPDLTFLRDSASPAASDHLGCLVFQGKDNATTPNTVNYAEIDAIINDPANASKDGSINFRQMTANVMTSRMTLNSTGMSVTGNIAATGNLNGAAIGATGAIGGATLNATGAIGAGTAIIAGGYVAALNGGMMMNAGASGRYMQFAPDWYWDWNSSNGRLAYHIPGGEWMSMDGAQFIVNMNAYKPGGGSWLATSDARIKDVHGPYDAGLEEILQVNPVRYNYKTDPDKEYIGVVAQEIEGVMPETVSLIEGEVDGKTVNDLRAFDNTALIYALVNAVKTLSAKIEALEAQLAGAPE